jgi:hypothetical protein
VDIAALSLRAAADTDPVLALVVLMVLIVPSSANKGLAVLPPSGEVVAAVVKACGRTAVGTEVAVEDATAPIVVLLLVPKRSGCKHSGVPSKCSASCTFKETRPECRLAQPLTMTPVAPAAAAAVAVPVATVATEPVVVAVVALLLPLAKIWP